MKGIVVVGGGLAGLSTAIKLKLYFPRYKVVVFDKLRKTANTFMSGMRFRKYAPGKYRKPPDAQQAVRDLRKLLAYIEEPEKINKFSKMIVQEIDFWEREIYKQVNDISKLKVDYLPLRFGPQWGEGKGKLVIDWLEKLADKIGVERRVGELVGMNLKDEVVESLVVKVGENNFISVHSSFFVLATGSSTGFLLASTNLKTTGSQVLLYFKKRLPLVCSTVYMVHPFGRALEDGTPLPGCWATDELADVEVWLDDKIRDKKTEELLKLHKLHDHFPETVERFLKFSSDGKAELRFLSKNKKSFSRVSIHYYQLGLKTVNGVKVEGYRNLYAVGDAEGWWFTNFKPRIPGLGLSKALVDAQLVVESVGKEVFEGEVFDRSARFEDVQFKLGIQSKDLELARKLFTAFFLKFYLGKGDKSDIESWKKSLQKMKLGEHLKAFYLSIIKAHRKRFIEGLQEPIDLCRI